MSSVAYSFDGNDATGTTIITLDPLSYTFTNSIEYYTANEQSTHLDNSNNVVTDNSGLTFLSSAVTSSSTYDNTQYSTTVSDTYAGTGQRPFTPLTIIGTFLNIDSGYTGPISDLVSTSSVSYGTSTYYNNTFATESFWIDSISTSSQITTITDYSYDTYFTYTTYYGIDHTALNYNYKMGNHRLTDIGYDSASMEGRNTDLSLVVPVEMSVRWNSASFISEISSSSSSYSTGTHEDTLYSYTYFSIYSPYIGSSTSDSSQVDGDSSIYNNFTNTNAANVTAGEYITWTTNDNLGGFVKLGQSSNSTYNGFTFGHDDPLWVDDNVIGGALVGVYRVSPRCPALIPATVAQSPFGYILNNAWAASWGIYQIDGVSQTQIVNYDISAGQTFGRPVSTSFVNSYGSQTFDTWSVQQNSLPAIFNGSDSATVTVSGVFGFTSYTTGSASSSHSTCSYFSNGSPITLTGADFIEVGQDGLVANTGGAGWI